jgi:hypothetical protein
MRTLEHPRMCEGVPTKGRPARARAIGFSSLPADYGQAKIDKEEARSSQDPTGPFFEVRRGNAAKEETVQGCISSPSSSGGSIPKIATWRSHDEEPRSGQWREDQKYT